MDEERYWEDKYDLDKYVTQEKVEQTKKYYEAKLEIDKIVAQVKSANELGKEVDWKAFTISIDAIHM